MTLQVAIYGKGGIGKSTIAANISAAMAKNGRRVLQVGCDPKHDSTRLLLKGQSPPTILDYIRDTPPDDISLDSIVWPGEFGIDCAEAGGPEPGIGCAGRGILTTFDLLDRLGVRRRGYDSIIYDVLGDVVCGGFAVPIREEYSDKVYIVTSGEFMSIYAANNILRGLANYETSRPRVGGIIMNARGGESEDQRVARFAEAVGLPIVMALPRDEAFAQSERQGRCLVAEYPASELARCFAQLAEAVWEGPTYSARPLADDELERSVLEGLPVGLTAAGQQPAAPEAVAPAPEVSALEAPADAAAPAGAPRRGKPDKDDISPASPAGRLLSKAVTMKEPLHGCAFNGVLSTTTQLSDCVTVAHGPRSCAHIAFQAITSISRRLMLERGIVLPMQTAPPIVSTDMSESVMVFGGADALEQKIREVMASKPAAVFVVSTCPSGIIGEDIMAVSRFSTSTTQVIPIAADGNLTGDHQQGVFLGYQTIAEHVIDRHASPEPGLVNIVAEKTIAESTTANLQFANEVFSKLGLKLNCRFLSDSSYTEVRGFMRAPLNILAYADYMGLALKGYLEDSFGARFMDGALPIGFDDSVRWVGELAEYAGRPEAAEAVVSGYRRSYLAEVERLRPFLLGKRLMVVTFNHDIDWIISAALDVGMEVAFVGILEYSQDHRFKTRYGAEIGELATNLDYTALTRMDDVRRISPDVLLGNYLPGDGLGVPVCDTIQLCPDVGFLSGIRMAARWADLSRMNLGEGWRQDAGLYRQYCA